jgi:hypothetical protein
MSDYGRCPAFGYECEYVAKVEAQAGEIERLKGKLREIEDMCPVTCDMSVAHAMADVATEALEGKAEQ